MVFTLGSNILSIKILQEQQVVHNLGLQIASFLYDVIKMEDNIFQMIIENFIRKHIYPTQGLAAG